MKLLFIEPLVPHYRLPFFDEISTKYNIQVFYGRKDKSFYCPNRKYITQVKSVSFQYFEYYFILYKVFKYKPDVIITIGELKQITNIVLLILKNILNYKLIFWTHGFKNKITIKEKLKLLEYKRSDGVIFYTEKCMQEGQSYLKDKTLCFLNNTLDVNKINETRQLIHESKEMLKEKFNIKTTINGVFISRFTKIKNPNLLLELMIKSHKQNDNVGFFVIGSGKWKPDFSAYNYIYDFGQVYNDKEKASILKMADFSFMPSGIGLSIIEAFCYGLPMFTLSNVQPNIRHGVEFNYLRNGENGYIGNSRTDLIKEISNINPETLKIMSENAIQLVNELLTMDNMVKNFLEFIKQF